MALKKPDNYKLSYMIVMYLLGVIFSLYYTYTRTVIGKTLGEDYGFIALMVAMESIPGFFAVLLGFASDKIGRRKMLFTGFLASIVLFIMGNVDPRVYPLLAFAYMFFYMSFQPTVYGIVLHSVGGKGLDFSWFLLVGSLGWATGGVIPGLIETHLGSAGVFYFGSILLITATLLSIIFYPSRLAIEKIFLSEFTLSIKKHTLIILGLVIGSAGVGLFIGAYALKLYAMIQDTLKFGLVFSSIPGIFGSLVRPLAGYIVDKYSPEKVLAAVFIAYMILGLIIINISGILIIILWFTPLYPFYETSGYTMLSRRLPPSLQATAAGLFSTAVSISGFINMFASIGLTEQSFNIAVLLSIVLLLSSAVWIVLFSKRKNISNKKL